MELCRFTPAKNITLILVSVAFLLQGNFNFTLNDIFSNLLLYTSDWEQQYYPSTHKALLTNIFPL